MGKASGQGFDRRPVCAAFGRFAQVPVPHGLPDGFLRIIGRDPSFIFVIPCRFGGFAHTREQKFDHVARDVRVVGFFFVQDVVVNQHNCARWPGREEVLAFLLPGRDVLRFWNHAGGAHFVGRILRIIHRHHPAAVVMAAVVVPRRTGCCANCLCACRAPRCPDDFRGHGGAGASNNPSRGCWKTRREQRDDPTHLAVLARREEVVARVFAPGFCKGFVDAFIDFRVKSLWKIGLEHQIPIPNELLHLCVGQQNGFVCHGAVPFKLWVRVAGKCTVKI